MGELIVDKSFRYDKELFLQFDSLSPMIIRKDENSLEGIWIGHLNGVIEQVNRKSGANSTNSNLLINISDQVYNGQVDAGLYNFSIHPNNKLLAVSYSYDLFNDSVNIGQRFSLISLKKEDFGQEKILFELPANDHFGGGLSFDKKSNLYIATGDGQYGDTLNRSQSLQSLYGKILKYQVHSFDSLSIPLDNPFLDSTGVLPEIYALGLRNPFRIHLNEFKNEIVIADVGHTQIEELSIAKSGSNLGWNIKEGSERLRNIEFQGELVDPFYEYKHGFNGFSITGGIIYSGKKFPNLKDKYIFGDYLSGRIWAIDIYKKEKKAQLLLTKGGTITSFFESSEGDILWTDLRRHRIHKLKYKNDL